MQGPGFFFSMTDAYLEVRREAMARGARCTECPLYHYAKHNNVGNGPLKPTIQRNSKLVIVDEFPGTKDIEFGHMFSSKAGNILQQEVSAGGLDFHVDTSITSVALCQVPPNTNPEDYEAKLIARGKKRGLEVLTPSECCYPRLERDLDEADATVEYAAGRQPLKALARYHKSPTGKRNETDVHIGHLKKQHGAPVVVRPPEHPEGAKVVLGSYHPNYGLRGGKSWLPVIKIVIRRAAMIAARGGAIDWHVPPAQIDPTLADIQAFVDEVFATDRLVMVDIETGPSAPGAKDGASIYTCKLRTVGWGFTRDNGDEVVQVVPYHDMDGSPKWTPDEFEIVDALIRRVMDHAKLAGQNFMFDSGVLLNLGLMTDRNKRFCDLMLAHHNTDSDVLPHGLGFIISEHFEAPHHKGDVDHKSVDNVGYQALKIYNAADVVTQMRSLDAVVGRVTNLGNTKQFVTDTKLAPITRNMGDIGLVIDEHRRRELESVLTERVNYFRAKVRCEAALLANADVAEAKRVENAMARLKEEKTSPDRMREAFQTYADRHSMGELNLNSTNQLRDLLYDKLDLTPPLNTDGYEYDEEADDDPATSQAAILKLFEKYEHVREFGNALLEYRAYTKLLGTYVADKKGSIRDVDWTKWGLPPNPYKRLLNTSYKIHIIPSGRLSTQPAIQNWPALGKANMRTMVNSPDGHCLVGADYDQLELRIYAAVARDRLTLDALDPNNKVGGKKIDPHTLNAASLLANNETELWEVYKRLEFGDPKERKYWRTIAKRFAFLEIYGGEEEKLFSTMASSRDKGTGKLDFPNLTMKEVLEWHERWHKLHPETKTWQNKCHDEVRRHKKIRVAVLDERARHWFGGVDKKNAPPNHTIQGFGAAVANRALIELASAIPYRGWSPVSGLNLQVHDYIGAYVPRHRAMEAKRVFEECMLYEYQGVKFTATAEMSERWSDQG